MSLSGILKPNGYNLYANNIFQSQPLNYKFGTPTGASGYVQLDASDIIGTLLLSPNDANQNRVFMLPAVADVFSAVSASGGEGIIQLYPDGTGFNCTMGNNTSGYNLGLSSSGGADNFNINVSGGDNYISIPWSKAVQLNFNIFIDSSGAVFGNCYPIGV